MALVTPEYCLKRFGDPRKAERKWCTLWQAPVSKRIFTVPARIYMHRLMAPNWDAAYREIYDAGLGHLIKTWNGCFNIRLMTGSRTKWSLHAYGLAVDFNAGTNSYGKKGDMDPRITKIMKANGFFWGGDFKRPDPMHYEPLLETIT